MKRWRLAGWVGARSAGLALALSVAAGFGAGVREIAAQGYASHGYWRLALLALRGATQTGLAVGFLFACLVFIAASATAAIIKRRGAGWAAAVSVAPVASAVVLILRAGLISRFPTLFPAAYASAPGIAPDTVFWVFLPPLVYHILLAAPGGHWADIALIAGLVVCASMIIGVLVGLVLRRVYPDAVDAKSRRIFAWFAPPLVALGVAALLLGTPATAARDRTHPDVILISIDTVRADALGCYGAAPSPSPTLDGFARHADRYVRAYAPSSWTIPSHAGLLTGLSNHRHGAQTMDTRLPDSLFTLSERMAEAGYDTGAFVNSFMLSPRYGFGQGFGEYVMDPDSPGERVVDQALTWLKPRGRRPVFLFVHLFDPHWPYGPADAALPGGAAKDFHEFAAAVLNADENVRRVWVARYREAVRHADHAVGRLFAALQASGRWNDAWVIVVSDHGEEWWDHGFLGHAVTLFDEVLHVPLLLKRPGQTAARAIDRPVSLLDVPATLVEELQLPGARDLDGRDLLRADAEPRSLFASSAIWGEPRFALIRGCGKGITSYHWRFGRFHGERPDSYYDLCADPAEAHNGAEVESGLTLLSQLWMQTGAMRPRGGVAASTPSPLVRERLRDLGYLQ